MHFHAEVHIDSLEKDGESLSRIVFDVMVPYYMSFDESDHEDAFFDYSSIGGRFDKMHSENNVCEVKNIPDSLRAGLIVAGGKVFDYENEFDDSYIGFVMKKKTRGYLVKKKLEELGINSGYIVTVDCHC